jgi:peptide/nickel transport system permease protein
MDIMATVTGTKFGYSFYCDLFGVVLVGRWQQIRNYVLVRLLLAPVMLWTVVKLVFLLLRATPGDPVDAIYGGRAPASVKEALRVQLGLDQPLWGQYLAYLGQLLRGDLGTSLTEPGRSVGEIIGAYLPATVELGLAGFLVAAGLGVGLGLMTGSRPESSPLAIGGKVFSLVSYAVPLFWLGMLLQLWLSVNWRWFPLGVRFPVQEMPPAGATGLYVLDSLLAGNWRQLRIALHHLALPSVTLGVVLSGLLERMVRVQVRAQWRGDYVEAARARGIPVRWLLGHHVLPNALIPVVALLGLTLASLLGGAIVTEVTFSWPGLANRLYEAINLRDYPTVQGIVVFLAVVVVVLSILIDVLTAFIDPRVRL